MYTIIILARISEGHGGKRMKCALAAVGFLNGDVQHNQRVMKHVMKGCSGRADVVLFGEAFLQGFYGATFEAAHDRQMALYRGDAILQEIGRAAKTYAIASSFGFIEKDGDSFYSSQMTLGADGKIMDLYRRVSPGWKEAFADAHYREGDAFHAFTLHGKKVVVGLCGDLWYDANIDAINQLHPDVVFWPVYTDYPANEWNTAVKQEYAQQAGKLGCPVLYVNSLCKDKVGDDIARGGAALFVDGTIVQEVPSGEENVLFVEI